VLNKAFPASSFPPNCGISNNLSIELLINNCAKMNIVITIPNFAKPRTIMIKFEALAVLKGNHKYMIKQAYSYFEKYNFLKNKI
jgi:hypothetical protein